MMLLLDTNILIEILKNNKDIINFIKKYKISDLYISSISIMELYYGALNKIELQQLKKFVKLFNVIHLSNDISIKSVDLIDRYTKSHSLDIPDSLIASSAIINNIPIYTLNLKDFKFIDELDLV